LRIGLGVVWLAHACLKWLVFSLSGTATYFESVGFYGFLAYPVFVAEVAGGIALILGLYVRQVALALVPILIGALWVHAPNGWTHTSAGGGWEYPLFLIVASVAVALIGDGAVATRRMRQDVRDMRRAAA
jgi:putative oxidoreductase